MRFLILILIVTTTSCARVFQVYEVKSDDATMTDDLLVYEDDSIKLVYNFWSELGLMRFALQNKSNHPIYINWDKSKFISEGISKPYWSNTTKVESKFKSKSHLFTYSMLGYGGTGFGTALTSGSASSLITREIKQSIVPPNSWIEKNTYRLIENPEVKNKQLLEQLKIDKASRKDRRQMRNRIIQQDRLSYTPDTVIIIEGSAPTFRNYLSINSQSDTGNELFIDHKFQIHRVVNNRVKKREVSELKNKETDKASKFFYSRTDANISHSKNSVGFVFQLQPIYQEELVLGIEYARLLVPQFEIGSSYSIGLLGIDRGGGQPYSYPIFTNNQIHSVGLKFTGYPLPFDYTRIGVSLNIDTEILPMREGVVGSNNDSVKRQTLALLSPGLEFSVNLPLNKKYSFTFFTSSGVMVPMSNQNTLLVPFTSFGLKFRLSWNDNIGTK